MNPQQAYNSWAAQYDTDENKTRDLEAKALIQTLANTSFNSCLEIGCGTGKNTDWLVQKAGQVTCVDLSAEMLSKAKEKIGSTRVEFLRFDINNDWDFTEKTFELIGFSLVLEHIQNLDHVFKEVYKKLSDGGYVYIGELHSFKQYTGSKARFQTDQGIHFVESFNHHISDFIQSAKKYGLMLRDLDEYFDNDDKTSIPRILTLLLQKA